jgi:hypothetical protein
MELPLEVLNHLHRGVHLFFLMYSLYFILYLFVKVTSLLSINKVNYYNMFFYFTDFTLSVFTDTESTILVVESFFSFVVELGPHAINVNDTLIAKIKINFFIFVNI